MTPSLLPRRRRRAPHLCLSSCVSYVLDFTITTAVIKKLCARPRHLTTLSPSKNGAIARPGAGPIAHLAACTNRKPAWQEKRQPALRRRPHLGRIYMQTVGANEPPGHTILSPTETLSIRTDTSRYNSRSSLNYLKFRAPRRARPLALARRSARHPERDGARATRDRRRRG